MEREMSEKLLPRKEVELWKRVWEESKKIWVVAGPAIFSRSSTFGVSFITQIFIGHVGYTELAAYALVFTVFIRFTNGILLGMASALETLCGQAYGAKQYHMLGVYLQRSWIVLIACAILILPCFIFAAPILRFLGQDESLALAAGNISLWLIPVIFSYVFSFSLQMYLQAQSKNKIITYLAALSLSIHIFLSWLMVTKLSLGVAGAMCSLILAMWIPIIGQFVYLFGWCQDTWKGLSSSAFSDLCPVIKLSLSSGAMVCLEVWYNSILILLTGHMRNAEVEIDALSICVRVANELGAGSAKAAKFSIVVVATTSLSLGLLLFVIFLSLRGRLAYIFTDNFEVVRAVADLSPLLAFSILLNSIQPVLSGVSVGAGWQSIVAYVNITCYYVIGIPLGIILGYLIGYQVKGIWIGMMVGTAAQTIVLMYITWRTDWDKQVAIAQERVNKWVLPKPEGPNDRTEVA